MEREELIRLVTAEVERRLAAQQAEQPAPRTLALVEPGPGFRSAISLMLKRESAAAVLVGGAAQMPEAAGLPALLPVLADDPNHLERDVLSGIECLLLPCLRPATAARIALGLDGGTVPRLVSAALWAGKRIEAAVCWSRSAGPTAYRAMYEEYLERLRSFGVTLLEPEGGEPDRPRSEAFHGKLLTEADVQRLSDGGLRRLVLEPSTLVTALAHDLVRLRGLQLERR